MLKRKSKHTFYVPQCFSKNLAVSEIMTKNMLEPERPQMSIWRLVACWISRTTRAQERTRDRASIPTHTYTHAHALTHVSIHTHSLPRTHTRTHAHTHTDM
jgi:hypothetical protein